MQEQNVLSLAVREDFKRWHLDDLLFISCIFLSLGYFKEIINTRNSRVLICNTLPRAVQEPYGSQAISVPMIPLKPFSSRSPATSMLPNQGVKSQASSSFDLLVAFNTVSHVFLQMLSLCSFHDTELSWCSPHLTSCPFLVLFANSTPSPWSRNIGIF